MSMMLSIYIMIYNCLLNIVFRLSTNWKDTPDSSSPSILGTPYPKWSTL